MPNVTLDGLRMVIETLSAGTAGGSTIWQRSPCGRTVEQIGISALTSWRVKAAAALARVASQAGVRSGSSCQRQPPGPSTPTSPGRLMTSSVTSAGSSRRWIGCR